MTSAHQAHHRALFMPEELELEYPSFSSPSSVICDNPARVDASSAVSRGRVCGSSSSSMTGGGSSGSIGTLTAFLPPRPPLLDSSASEALTSSMAATRSASSSARSSRCPPPPPSHRAWTRLARQTWARRVARFLSKSDLVLCLGLYAAARALAHLWLERHILPDLSMRLSSS